MKEYDIISSAKILVENLMKNNDPSHDLYHVERVYKLAMHLAEKETALGFDLDMLVIQLSALFHDAVDFKYDHSKTKSLEQIAHERLGDFFDKHKDECTGKQREKIISIILNISWRKELESTSNIQASNELNIVRDADRLDAIGAIGVARCFAFSGVKMRPFFLADLKPMENMTAEEYNKQTILNQSTAINHFHEKLLLIKNKISTATGKALAETRHKFMLTYLEQFDRELNLE